MQGRQVVLGLLAEQVEGAVILIGGLPVNRIEVRKPLHAQGAAALLHRFLQAFAQLHQIGACIVLDQQQRALYPRGRAFAVRRAQAPDDQARGQRRADQGEYHRTPHVCSPP